MASNIKGITVEISGDTSKLKSSLKEVNVELSNTQKELNSVEKLLKLDPTNTEMLAQKQKLLSSEIETTKSKLQALKDAKKKADDEGIAGTEKGSKVYDELNRQIVSCEEKLKSLNKEMNSFGSVTAASIAAAGEAVKKTGDKIESVGKSLTVVSTAAAGILTAGVTYNAQMEKYETAITTLTGSSEKAAEIMEQIKEDAKATPFDVSGLTEANQLLLSTGLDASEARDSILALGNAISASGGGDDELSRMAVNLQQIKNTGKATALDIKQFAYAGIDIYGLLADYMEVSKEEAAELEVSWDMLNGALISASQEGGKYFGAMEKQSQTFNGAVSNLKDSLGQLVGSLTESLMPLINQIVDKINGFIDWFNSFDEGTKSMIANILLIVAAAGPVLIILGKIISSIGTIMTFAPTIVTAITTITTFITGTLIPALSSLFALLIANPIGLIITAIAAVIAIVILLYNKCDWFRNGVNAIVNTIVNFVTLAIEKIVEFFTVTIPAAFNAVINFVKENWQSLLLLLVNPIAGALSLLYNLNPKFKEWVTSVISAIKNGFSKMVDIGKYIVEGLWRGILNTKDWLLNKIKSFAHTITQGIKDFFGIESPSKVMRDEVGKYLAQGIGLGFDREMNSVISDMTSKVSEVTDSINSDLNIGNVPSVNKSVTSQNFYNAKTYQSSTEIVRQPSEVTIVLDKTKLGKVMIPVLDKQQTILGGTLA